jgi:hypothetical protein
MIFDISQWIREKETITAAGWLILRLFSLARWYY